MKRAGKYLLVVAGNGLVLTILLRLWTDKFQTTFNQGIDLLYFLYIIGISIVCLIALYVASIIMHKKKVTSDRLKVKYSIIICLLISSYYYIDFSIKIVKGPILKSKIQKSVVSKTRATELPNGIEVTGLTLEEYNEIRQVIDRPTLPQSAQNIYYAYDHDGFLPDFGLTIEYEVSNHEEVEEFKIEEEGYSESRSVKKENGKRIVTYQAMSW